MTRATDEALGHLHQVVADQLANALAAEPPDWSDQDPTQAAILAEAWAKNRLAVIDRALRMLKDNNITSTVEVSQPLRSIAEKMPTAQELENLMRLTP